LEVRGEAWLVLGRVECIGLPMGLGRELRRLGGTDGFQFVSFSRCQDYPLAPARGGQVLALVLGNLNQADMEENRALLQLPRRLWEAGRLAPVLVMGDESMAEAAWRAGVTDYLPLATSPQGVLQRLLATSRRLALLYPLWRDFQHGGRQLDRLTPRERYILERLADGWWIKKIAAELGTSPNTVRNQRTTILEKLQVHNEAEMLGFVHAARWFHALRTFLARDPSS